MKEDKRPVEATFSNGSKAGGLDDVKLIVGDKRPGMLDAAGEAFPDANCQRFTIHFYRRTQLATDVPHKTLFFTDEESGAITAILLL